MSHSKYPGGLVHEVPADLASVLAGKKQLASLWEGLTAIGRNEFLCWIEDAKRAPTRQKRIHRTVEELLEGRKRPCCWAGCIHRTDKKPGKWQQAVLIDPKAKR